MFYLGLLYFKFYVALTLLFINVKVNQPVNLTPVLAPLNYVSILAPAQIHPKANNRRYGLCKLEQAVTSTNQLVN
jgi:hypothetical protein